jgi:hypothetical protein
MRSATAFACSLGAVALIRLIWKGRMGRSRPSRDQQPVVHLMFVECLGERMVVDGLRETTGPGGGLIDAPFSLCFRRPRRSVEREFLQLLHASMRDGPLEVTVRTGEVRFRTSAGQVTLPLDDAPGWPVDGEG